MNKIKAIIFDLDGVLVNTKNIHFKALNSALTKCNINYQISTEDHLKIYDGLPTLDKLNILWKKKLIKKRDFKKIVFIKNIFTNQEISKIKYNKKIYKIFEFFSKKYMIAIATNAIRKTLDLCIKRLRIKKFIFYSISNNEINYAKPHPEIYLKCFINMGLRPSENLILEDSHFGRIAALESGANLLPIKELNSLSKSRINFFLKTLNEKKSSFSNPWVDEELNIVVPMAGAGKRFEEAGYIFPKPLIEIKNLPMINWVLNSLNIKANYIFIVQKNHLDKYNLSSTLNFIVKNPRIITLNKLTKGSACTTLFAKEYIDNNKPLLLVNSDQFIEWNSSKAMYNFISKKVDGAILTFKSTHPKWSYARTNEKNNKVLEVAEKKVISNNATVGIYYWRHGKDYIKYTNSMIKKNITTNNEFYICPVFNEAIKDKKKIIIYEVDKMWGLGTPDDLEYFKRSYVGKNYSF
jgi:beta-phosphoglucomutase-like phosphatase (HAD superfamily)/dTDP-glucose pyrophosphorylase